VKQTRQALVPLRRGALRSPTCGILPFRRPRTVEDVWGVNVRCLEGVDHSDLPRKPIYGSRLD
jgi:hypothetical protein